MGRPAKPYPTKAMRLPIEFEQQLRKVAIWLIENKGKKIEELDLESLARTLITEKKQPEKEILEDYWADDFIEPRVIEIKDDNDVDDEVLAETTEADVPESAGFVNSSINSDVFVQVDTKETNNNNGNHRIDPRIKEIFEDIESSSAIIDLASIAEDIGITRGDFLFFCSQHKINGIFNKEAIKAGLKKEAERYFKESQAKFTATSPNL